jgi:hypothetical protein
MFSILKSAFFLFLISTSLGFGVFLSGYFYFRESVDIGLFATIFMVGMLAALVMQIAAEVAVRRLKRKAAGGKLGLPR